MKRVVITEEQLRYAIRKELLAEALDQKLMGEVENILGTINKIMPSLKETPAMRTAVQRIVNGVSNAIKDPDIISTGFIKNLWNKVTGKPNPAYAQINSLMNMVNTLSTGYMQIAKFVEQLSNVHELDPNKSIEDQMGESMRGHEPDKFAQYENLKNLMKKAVTIKGSKDVFVPDPIVKEMLDIPINTLLTTSKEMVEALKPAQANTSKIEADLKAAGAAKPGEATPTAGEPAKPAETPTAAPTAAPAAGAAKPKRLNQAEKAAVTQTRAKLGDKVKDLSDELIAAIHAAGPGK